MLVPNTAFAANETYIQNGSSGTVPSSDVTAITSNTDLWEENASKKWYVAEGNTAINTRVVIRGNVNLILKDGSKLTIDGGIRLTGNNSLTIYGQTGGSGELIVQNVNPGNAGIGGNSYEKSGTLTIYGGKITAQGGSFGAGIGGGNGYSGGSTAINGGVVTANGGFGAAGIGGGYSGAGGNINISGGTVTATGTNSAAGIGTATNGSGGTVTISGGVVSAMGGNAAPAIGNGTAGINDVVFRTGENGSVQLFMLKISKTELMKRTGMPSSLKVIAEITEKCTVRLHLYKTMKFHRAKLLL